MQIFSETLVKIWSKLSFLLPPPANSRREAPHWPAGPPKKRLLWVDLVCGAKESEVAFAIHVIGLI
jgi:hypothetical protein